MLYISTYMWFFTLNAVTFNIHIIYIESVDKTDTDISFLYVSQHVHIYKCVFFSICARVTLGQPEIILVAC